MLSQSSKNFFALSSRFFDTKTHGDVQLIGDLTFFAQPVEMGGFDLSIQTPSFSFTCWVKPTRTFVGGYLIRKRPSQTSDLSCWGWYLDTRCYVVCIHACAFICARCVYVCHQNRATDDSILPIGFPTEPLHDKSNHVSRSVLWLSSF